MFRKYILTVLFYCTAILSMDVVAYAQALPGSIQPYNSPTGFAILSRDQLDQNHQPMLYGGTSLTANWHFTQWGAPGDFPPLSYSPATLSNDSRWSSADPWSALNVYVKNGQYVENIQQDGANANCLTPNGKPSEFDLFIEPNGNRKGSVSAINPVYKTNKNFPTLGELSSLRVNGIFTVNYGGSSPGGTVCPANHAGAVYGIILKDDSANPPQMLWYDVQLAHVCVPLSSEHPGPDYRSCMQRTINPTAQWYWTGEGAPHPHVSKNTMGAVLIAHYALSDVLPSFGITPVADNRPNALSLDFLPRISSLIMSGNFGIDTNINHWRVSGVSYGQSLWGGTRLSTTWQGFTPSWTMK